MKFLIIEDNLRIADNITYILKKENYKLDITNNGEDGFKKALENEYNLIILDLMLPGMDGFEVLEGLRANQIDTAVLVLSAKGQVEDKVKALNLGSDDYITKPFAAAELLARIKSILRRKFNISTNVIKIGNLMVDTNKKEACVNGLILELTQKEYEILELLAYNKNKVVSKIALGQHIWQDNLDLVTMSNFIDVHISNLRKKIEKADGDKYIKTKRGLGFILSGDLGN